MKKAELKKEYERVMKLCEAHYRVLPRCIVCDRYIEGDESYWKDNGNYYYHVSCTPAGVYGQVLPF